MGKRFILCLILGAVLLVICLAIAFVWRNRINSVSPLKKICAFVDMESVEITTWKNSQEKIGGYFAATTDGITYKDAPGYLFNPNGDHIATDSFFYAQEKRLQFSQMINDLNSNYPIKTKTTCPS